MPEFVRVPIPRSDDPEDETDLVSYFQELTDEEFGGALDCEVEEHDDRAQIDSIEITAVNVEGDKITVTYEIEFSAYYGCRDMDYADTDERMVRGRRDGDDWVFAKHVLSPGRYPNDEL